MIESVKQLWLQALRSGKYEQAQGFLKRGRKDYCCLGVLCEIYRKETGKGRWVKSAPAIGPSSYRFQDGLKDSSLKVVPEAVKQWAGLTSSNPSFEIQDENTSAATMNDEGYSFETIAKAIEAAL